MVNQKTVKLFIEGGGKGTQNTQQLQSKMREAFHKLLKSYGLKTCPELLPAGEDEQHLTTM